MNWRRFPLQLLACALLLAPASPAFSAWPREGFAICALSGSQHDPLITQAGGGYVVWTDERDGHRQLYASDIRGETSEPTWPAGGVRIAPSQWGQQGATVESSTWDGSLFVVWSEDRGGGTGLDLYMQRYLLSGARAPGWPAGGVLVSGAPGAQEAPRITLATLSNAGPSAFVVWRDMRAGNTDVYAQVIAPDGQVRSGWPANGFAVSAEAGAEIPAGIMAEGSSYGATLRVLWEWEGRVVLQEFEDHAGPQRAYYWPAGGFVVSDTTAMASNAVMALSPANWEIEIAWQELRDTKQQVRFLHVPQSYPAPQFSPSVAVAPDVLSNQQRPRLLADYFQHVSVLWEDDRDDAGDIYRQNYELVGMPSVAQPLGGTAGEPVCVAAGRQHDVVASWHIYWVDEREGPTTPAVYGRQKAISDGHLMPEAVSLAPTPGAQSSPTADYFKGASVPELPRDYDLVAWTDTRDPATAPDIYVQAFGPPIQYLGPLSAPPIGDPGSLALSVARPTPATGPVTLTLSLPWTAEVSLDVVDVSGRLVRDLARGTLPAGRHDLTWDGRDRDGRSAAPGVYFVRGHAAGQSLQRRVVRLAP